MGNETTKNENEENNLMLQLQLLTKLSPALQELNSKVTALEKQVQELNSKVTALEKQVRKLNRKLKTKKEKVLL